MRDVVKDDINLTRIVDLPPSASPIPNIFGNPPLPHLSARKLPPQQPRKPLSARTEAHHAPRCRRWNVGRESVAAKPPPPPTAPQPQEETQRDNTIR